MDDPLPLGASLEAMHHRQEWALPQEHVNFTIASRCAFANKKQLLQALGPHQVCNRTINSLDVLVASPQDFNPQPICPTLISMRPSFVSGPLDHQNQLCLQEILADGMLTPDLRDQAWAQGKEWMLNGKLYERV